MALGALGDAVAMTDWERSVRRIETARPRWAPGEVPASHPLGAGDAAGRAAAGPLTFSPMGRLSSPRAFGHNGSNVAIGWADPDRDLVFAYVNNLATGYVADYTHLAAVADAVLDAVGE